MAMGQKYRLPKNKFGKRKNEPNLWVFHRFSMTPVCQPRPPSPSTETSAETETTETSSPQVLDASAARRRYQANEQRLQVTNRFVKKSRLYTCEKSEKLPHLLQKSTKIHVHWKVARPPSKPITKRCQV